MDVRARIFEAKLQGKACRRIGRDRKGQVLCMKERVQLGGKVVPSKGDRSRAGLAVDGVVSWCCCRHAGGDQLNKPLSYPFSPFLSLSYLNLFLFQLSNLTMPPRGSNERLDFTPILTHYLFLFTSVFAVVSVFIYPAFAPPSFFFSVFNQKKNQIAWFIAFIAQIVATSRCE